jgi:hypothetical protein
MSCPRSAGLEALADGAEVVGAGGPHALHARGVLALDDAATIQE